MSVFQLPKTLYHDINSMMPRFWWGHKGNDSQMASMRWRNMGISKNCGGVRDLECFNLALLAEQGWRIL